MESAGEQEGFGHTSWVPRSSPRQPLQQQFSLRATSVSESSGLGITKSGVGRGLSLGTSKNHPVDADNAHMLGGM